MKRMNLRYTIICMAVALAALGASARTVYDAGKALRQNFQNNATPENPYTDENGGIWKYSSALISASKFSICSDRLTRLFPRSIRKNSGKVGTL